MSIQLALMSRLSLVSLVGGACGQPVPPSSPANLADPAADVAGPALPAPTGRFAIGRSTFHWTDPSRAEEPAYHGGPHRELLVHLHYPIDARPRGPRAVYMPHLREVETFENRFAKDFTKQSYGASYPAVATMRTHSVEDADLAAGTSRYPVLVFSHGGGMPVLFYSAIIEDLVSHGYVVAAVEHSFDGATMVFPDGHVITQEGWEHDSERSPDERAAFHLARHDVGARDQRFVLDQLIALDAGRLPGPARRFAGRLDTARAGALGHSFGGMVSTTTCRQDRRFDICINLDGGLDKGASYGVLTQPVAAMIGDRRTPRKPDESEEQYTKRVRSRAAWHADFRAAYAELTAAGHFVLIDSPGFSHYSYYDVPDAEAQAKAEWWPTAPGLWARNKQIIRALTLAILNLYLADKPVPLESILSMYPEVAIEPLRPIDQLPATRKSPAR